MNSDVAHHIRRKAGEPELVVAVSDTFDVHFVDNVEIFFAGLAADAGIGEWIHSLAGESYRSSCSVVMSRLLAFVLDPADIPSYADDNCNFKL